MVYVVLGIVVIVIIVMILKKIMHLRVEDGDYSDNDDYLERRIKNDEEDK